MRFAPYNPNLGSRSSTRSTLNYGRNGNGCHLGEGVILKQKTTSISQSMRFAPCSPNLGTKSVDQARSAHAFNLELRVATDRLPPGFVR